MPRESGVMLVRRLPLSPVLHVVLRSCLLHKQHSLSYFKGISAFPGKHAEQNGGLVPPVSQCWLSVHHMHAMHFLKSPNMHCTFAFLSITLACPRLFDKQALQQSFSILSTNSRKCQRRLLGLPGRRNRQTISRPDTANAPSHSGPRSLSSRPPQQTTHRSSPPGGDAGRKTQHARRCLVNTRRRLQRTRRPRHDIRTHCMHAAPSKPHGGRRRF